MNCWEYMKCNRGNKDLEQCGGSCPAYPAFGKQCSMVAGTLCKGQVKGSFAWDRPDCAACDFYNSAHYNRTPISNSVCL